MQMASNSFSLILIVKLVKLSLGSLAYDKLGRVGRVCGLQDGQLRLLWSVLLSRHDRLSALCTLKDIRLCLCAVGVLFEAVWRSDAQKDAGPEDRRMEVHSLVVYSQFNLGYSRILSVFFHPLTEAFLYLSPILISSTRSNSILIPSRSPCFYSSRIIVTI